MFADNMSAIILNDTKDLIDFKDFIVHGFFFEKFERWSRRRATFENKHILALQPHSLKNHRHPNQATAERGEAYFVRMVRKTRFHAA